jgi:hypothetical protein
MTMTLTSTLPPEDVGDEALSSIIQDSLSKCKHYFLVGDKDQGKSALSCAILQEHHDHTKRPCFIYQPPKPELLPSWVSPITDLDKLPIGAVCVIDEASTEFSQYSNRTLSNRKLADLMQIARHRDQSIILISQTSKRLNRNLLYPIDVYLLKKPTLFQVLEERPLIRKAYERIEEPIQVNEYYWMDQDRFEKGTFTKPAWYTPELSKAYSEISAQDERSRKVPNLPIPQAAAVPKNIRREPLKTEPFAPLSFRNTHVRSRGLSWPHLPTLNLPSGGSRSFEPGGLLLSVIVGGFGLFSLIRGSWTIALLCLPLAAAGLFYSHNGG